MPKKSLLEDENGKTKFLPQFCIIHEGNSSLSGNTRGPFIKDVGNISLFLTPPFSSRVFYSNPSSVFNNYLTPPPSKLQTSVMDGPQKEWDHFAVQMALKGIHYFCKKQDMNYSRKPWLEFRIVPSLHSLKGSNLDSSIFIEYFSQYFHG